MQDPVHHLVGELPVAAHPQQRLPLRTEHELHHLLVGERAVFVPVVFSLVHRRTAETAPSAAPGHDPDQGEIYAT